MKEKKEKKSACCKHMTSIGGQAVIEGVMMRGPEYIATAVRKSDGEIIIDKKPVNSFVSRYKLHKVPVLRGILSFFESMVTGTRCLMFSADQVDLEDDDDKEPSKFEKWLDNKLGDKVKDIAIYFSVFVSLIFSVAMFMLLPTFIAGLFDEIITNRIVLNILEGFIKILIFLFYLWAVSHMKDIRTVFEYHGAEHKTIAAYEAGVELTAENAMKYTRLHPRCGTSFLLIVMVVSILTFSCLSWGGTIERIIYRLLLLPAVAGVSYEIIKLAGKRPDGIVGILTKPGLWLQKITTREPSLEQLEVAIASMKEVIPATKEEDKW